MDDPKNPPASPEEEPEAKDQSPEAGDAATAGGSEETPSVPSAAEPEPETPPAEPAASPGGVPETVTAEAPRTTPTTDEKEEEEEAGEKELGGRMTFLEHLDELRKRILYSVTSLFVTFTVSWIFHEEIFEFLSRPIKSVVTQLVVIKPTEPFTIYLKVAFVGSVFLAVPFILFQVWLFIAPGLYRREKHYALPFLLASTTLFVLGGLFAYYVVLPPALEFLLNEFGAEFAKMISAVEFFDFELLIIIGMGVIFQMPVLVAFLSIFGLITPGFLWRNFRYAFLIITIVAAVVSPTTDPFNLFIWTGPMVVLYVISIGISWVFKRKRARDAEETSRRWS